MFDSLLSKIAETIKPMVIESYMAGHDDGYLAGYDAGYDNASRRMLNMYEWGMTKGYEDAKAEIEEIDLSVLKEMYEEAGAYE